MGGCHNSRYAARTTPVCLCVLREGAGGEERNCMSIRMCFPLLTKFPLRSLFPFLSNSFMCIQCAPLAVCRITTVTTYIRGEQGGELGAV